MQRLSYFRPSKTCHLNSFEQAKQALHQKVLGDIVHRIVRQAILP